MVNMIVLLLIKFNGLEITLEMLESGKNPFLADYLRWIEENKGINLDLSSYEKRLGELKSKLAKTIFGRGHDIFPLYLVK